MFLPQILFKNAEQDAPIQSYKGITQMANGNINRKDMKPKRDNESSSRKDAKDASMVNSDNVIQYSG